MTNVTRLSPEIILEIMELLDLSDICPLIQTSPLFLQHFLTHRHQLLKSTVNDLNHRLVRCNFSIFLSALRLRCRHSENAPSTQSSARQLLIELEGVTDSYAPKAWCEKQDSKMVKPASLVLSLNEKRRFIQAAIHFETYCRMFFLQEKVLFKRNASIRQLFFNTTNETFVEQGPFYSITYYVFNQYLTMIKNTTTNLPTTMPPSRDQCMNLLTQTEFMLDWFYKVSQSPDPLVLMVNGIDLHRKGTLESRPWQPWEGIEGQSYRTLAPWRRGSYFWDRDRIQSLGGIPL
ncbi:uncharacterized protein B0J16DRAFT_375679 [Fusarium flagelliforme]|uniref:uncharacterized protein n=1 Tax=Fusarium flagelliforme TaxID=2675880 RepID=UPI001E8E8E0A|nr:uncharacterized protein B0J16DRAFT_375679 [Fusarium flagelliforme]KAH7174931.1 hypothetical protein B0J16DRAFT_375679 [Fusarium flagelliforme]